MRHTRRFTTVAATTACGALFTMCIAACSKGSTQSAPAPALQAGSPTIEVTHVVQQPVDVTLSMPGELDPYQTVAIYPKVTGFVKSIRVDRGSRVAAGEVLAQLEAPEIVAQRGETESKLQAAEAQVGQVRAQLDVTQNQAEYARLRAPADGVIAARQAEAGQVVAAGQPVFTLAADGEREIAISLPKLVARLAGWREVVLDFTKVRWMRTTVPATVPIFNDQDMEAS